MRWLWIVAFGVAFSMVAVGWLVVTSRQAEQRFDEFASRLWQGSEGEAEGRRPVFYESQLAEEDPVIQRYFQWSLDDGTEIPRAARITFRGRIRLGRDKPWMPHRSRQVIRLGTGFIWQAKVQGNLPFVGADQYAENEGGMEWRLFGLFPVFRAVGGDLTRSARWRFAAEHLLIPGALLPDQHVRWHPTSDHGAIVHVPVDDVPHELHLKFDREGLPRKVSFSRWGNFETPDGRWQAIPYAVRCEGVFRKGGYTLPRQYTAYWWSGTEKELAVVELEIEDVTFR